jgi:hypothetical protein
MFITDQVTSLFHKLHPDVIKFINLVDSLSSEQAISELNKISTAIHLQSSAWEDESEEVLNEVYLLNKFIKLMGSYSAIWMNIAGSKFADSWHSLQDSLDHLRSVKKFSKGTGIRLIDFLENQLIELGKLYPYNLFFSMGAKVDWFECSICGKDIDSLECEHIKGELYRGKLAYGMAKGIGSIDHVAMVKYPQDKRCVIKYEDDGPQFMPVRYLADLLTSKTMNPLSFHHLVFSKRMEKNTEFKKLPRNEICFCGSGRKFKKCCIDKEFIEFEHIDIVPHRIYEERDFETGVACLLLYDKDLIQTSCGGNKGQGSRKTQALLLQGPNKIEGMIS